MLNYGPPQGPQFNYGPNQKGWIMLQVLGRPPFLWTWTGMSSSGHMGQFGHHHPWTPGNPFKIGPRGTSIAAIYHGPWNAGCGR
ncbi:hypothetical protein O181_045807 [Austropuccinia psidii MF-1]|uniref:Uncharacterized protein n=1 Tax=Austropuccinia psidii MF-1 TaxID=1389203 RepID=A0A9Q3DQ25_9BASI|nr:hypothetical protein [Austropuccinia psidii MF-1]